MNRMAKSLRSGKKLKFSSKEGVGSKIRTGIGSVDSQSISKNTKDVFVMNPIPEDADEFILPERKSVKGSNFKRKLSKDSNSDLGSEEHNRDPGMPSVIVIPTQRDPSKLETPLKTEDDSPLGSFPNYQHNHPRGLTELHFPTHASIQPPENDDNL